MSYQSMLNAVAILQLSLRQRVVISFKRFLPCREPQAVAPFGLVPVY